MEVELKIVQALVKDLEGFLKWMQEAETTVNVLADASQRETALEDSACIGELKKQMQVRARECVCVCVFTFTIYYLHIYYCESDREKAPNKLEILHLIHENNISKWQWVWRKLLI